LTQNNNCFAALRKCTKYNGKYECKSLAKKSKLCRKANITTAVKMYVQMSYYLKKKVLFTPLYESQLCLYPVSVNTIKWYVQCQVQSAILAYLWNRNQHQLFHKLTHIKTFTNLQTHKSFGPLFVSVVKMCKELGN
jgi:hypothetical protein